ncbi:MAG TPA: ATP-binding protein [Candidatus Acidoferrum sp.]|nr:ATP-binding protein [Candidatus Acidoferrum sp.]
MNRGVIVRLAIFIATIVLLVALIGWTAHSSWRRIKDSHDNLEWQSFQIANHVQQNILSLNNRIYLYAAYTDHQNDWTNIVTTIQAFQYWLDQNQPLLSSKTEGPLLGQIYLAYKDYIASAMAIHARVYGSRRAITRVDELADFEIKSQRMLDLSFQLAQAQQNSLDEFRLKTLRSLDVLRLTLFTALGALVFAGCWLAFVVYREMIAPLQTQLVESRQIAERQEKLASLGMLAAGVAHEIRNPLTAIKAWLFLQQKHLTPDSPEFADAELIEGEIDRLERIVKDFLQFARPPEPQFTVARADQPLIDVQTLLQPEFEKSKIEIVLGETASAQIRIDPQQMKQVLINLVRNAADSIGQNGTVVLRVRLDDKRISDRTIPVVILEISDTGKGIPPEAEKRLFDPFFTTKDHGTGLGLPIAARIIEKHHGALQYQTQPDQGTTFGIILPRVCE